MRPPPTPGISRDASLMTAIAELGMPLIEYSPNWKPGLVLAGVGVTAIAFGTVAVWLVGIGTIPLLMGAASLWEQYRSQGYRICPGGIIVIGWRAVESCAWERVATLVFLRATRIMYGWSVGTGTLSAVVVRDDARRFVLKWLTPEIIEFIEGETYRVLLPRVREALGAGQEFAFGDVTIGPEGLRHARALIRWEEIESMDFRYTVTVRRRGAAPAYIWNVPNLSLFRALVDERLTSGRGTSSEGSSRT